MSTPRKLPHQGADDKWKGYNIDELHYARAYTAARIEISKDRLIQTVDHMRKTELQPFASKGIAGKILGAFSYVDLAVIAWKIGRRVFNVARMLKR